MLLLEHDRYAWPWEDNNAPRPSGDAAEHMAELREHYGDDLIAIYPVWATDHGNVSFRVTKTLDNPYGGWDSGLAGFIVALKSQYVDVIGCDPTETFKVAGLEMDEYESWTSGDTWGYKIETPCGGTCGTWTEVESCWGFIGREWAESEAEAALKWLKDQPEKVLDTVSA